MSKADLDRFVADLKRNTKLRDAVVKGAGGVQAAINVAKAHGYSITIDEARSYMRDQAANLSDKELDALAGGKGGVQDHPKPAPGAGGGAKPPTATTVTTQVQVENVVAVVSAAIDGSVTFGQVVTAVEGVIIVT
jgi:predicted ribosomally synthesized peptide with nif11-like leader